MTMNKSEIIAYLQGKDDSSLMAEADRVRRAVFGDEVYIRGIIEYTNHCRQNCFYCGLRSGNRAAVRYRLTRAEIFTAVETAVAQQIPTIVLQGGEDPHYSAEWVAEIIREIISKYDLAITLSLGEQSPEVLRLWRAAGANRYLLRIETWNRANYQSKRPGRRWENRLDCLHALRDLGYEVGSGIMVGLPGETIDTLAEAILGLTSLDLDMIGIGPFLAHPQTPLKDEPNGAIQLTLRTLALVRILIRTPICLRPAHGMCRERGPHCRSESRMNVIMPSITRSASNDSTIFIPGKNADNDDSEIPFAAVMEIFQEAGYRRSYSQGISPNWPGGSAHRNYHEIKFLNKWSFYAKCQNK
jgi:biotin synthase